MDDAPPEESLAIFSADYRYYLEFSARDGQIRAKYGVDDVESGLLLRSGSSTPLGVEKARAAIRL